MDKNVKISLKDIKQVVEKIVKKRPTYEYNWSKGCCYIRGNTPSCLIGKALYQLGVSKNCLKWMDQATSGGDPASINEDSCQRILQNHGVFMDKDAIDFAFEIQTKQDGGLCWKECLRETNECVC